MEEHSQDPHWRVRAIVGNLTVSRLKGVLRAYKCSVSGRKAELHERLLMLVRSTPVNELARMEAVILRSNFEDYISMPSYQADPVASDPPTQQEAEAPIVPPTTYSEDVNRSLVQPQTPIRQHSYHPQETSGPAHYMTGRVIPTEPNFNLRPFFEVVKLISNVVEFRSPYYNPRQGTKIIACFPPFAISKLRSGELKFCLLSGSAPPSEEQGLYYPFNCMVSLCGLSVSTVPETRGIRGFPGSVSPLDLTYTYLDSFGDRNPTVKFNFNVSEDTSRDDSTAEKSFVVGAFLLRPISMTELLRELKSRPRIPISDAIKIIKGDEEDGDIVTTQALHSLKDPVVRTRMRIPIRSRNCDHLDCMDAEAFLVFLRKTPRWKCAHCNGDITWESMAVDELMTDILNNTKESADKVSINDDATWTVLSSDSDSEESSSDEQVAKRPRQNQPEVIDLLEDSEDEVLPPRAAAGPRAAAAGYEFSQPAAHGNPAGGAHRHPPAGTFRHPPAGAHRHPPAGTFRHPPAGAYRHPPAGVNRHPPAGAYRHPPAGTFRHPPAGAYRHPPAGAYRHPPAGAYRDPSAGAYRDPSAGACRDPSAAAREFSQAGGPGNTPEGMRRHPAAGGPGNAPEGAYRYLSARVRRYPAGGGPINAPEGAHMHPPEGAHMHPGVGGRRYPAGGALGNAPEGAHMYSGVGGRRYPAGGALGNAPEGAHIHSGVGGRRYPAGGALGNAPAGAQMDPTADTLSNAPTDTPGDPAARAQVDPAAGAHVDSAAETPGNAPTDTPGGPPLVGAQVDPPASAQVDPPAGAQVDSPAGAHEDPPASAQVDPPAGAQVDSPASAHLDSPASAHEDPPAGAHEDPPASAHLDSPASAHEDPPAGAQVDSPAGAQVDSPAGAHVDPPAGAHLDSPAGAQVDSPAGAHLDPPASAHLDQLANTPGNASTDTSGDPAAGAHGDPAVETTVPVRSQAHAQAHSPAPASTPESGPLPAPAKVYTHANAPADDDDSDDADSDEDLYLPIPALPKASAPAPAPAPAPALASSEDISLPHAFSSTETASEDTSEDELNHPIDVSSYQSLGQLPEPVSRPESDGSQAGPLRGTFSTPPVASLTAWQAQEQAQGQAQGQESSDFNRGRIESLLSKDSALLHISMGSEALDVPGPVTLAPMRPLPQTQPDPGPAAPHSGLPSGSDILLDGPPGRLPRTKQHTLPRVDSHLPVEQPMANVWDQFAASGPPLGPVSSPVPRPVPGPGIDFVDLTEEDD